MFEDINLVFAQVQTITLFERTEYLRDVGHVQILFRFTLDLLCEELKAFTRKYSPTP